MRLDDPEVVAREYASEKRFVARRVVFPDREAVRTYLAALIRGREIAERLPEFTGSSRARSCQALFAAEKAA